MICKLVTIFVRHIQYLCEIVVSRLQGAEIASKEETNMLG
jgi:hypothetical protein